MATTKTFSVPDDWKYRKKFIHFTSKELQELLEKIWGDDDK